MKKPKKLRISCALQSRLKSTVRQGRRETTYRMLNKRNGYVPCFVCEMSVMEKHATLEHIIAQADGGTDDMDNLSISHKNCNLKRDRIPY